MFVKCKEKNSNPKELPRNVGLHHILVVVEKFLKSYQL